MTDHLLMLRLRERTKPLIAAPIEYRPLQATDVAAIARVHARACLVAYRFMSWSYPEEAVRQWYAGKFPEWDWGLIAHAHDCAAGFVATAGTHIDQLFVDPDYQRRGIGTALLAAALKRIAAGATLNVFADNAPARRFYERHGFGEARRFMNEEHGAVELLYRRAERALGAERRAKKGAGERKGIRRGATFRHYPA
jgi:ribosomal protein S18 acetylase RimI-like enzyme